MRRDGGNFPLGMYPHTSAMASMGKNVLISVLLFLCAAPVFDAMRIGVTGAHGFLGNEIAWTAASQGHQVEKLA